MDEVPTWGSSPQNQTSEVLPWVDPYRHLVTELFGTLSKIVSGLSD